MPTRVTVESIRERKVCGEPITMLTAYDYSLAHWVDRAGVDIVLVGDSLGMVMLGDETTAAVTMEQMLSHARAVCRAVKRALVIGDLPKVALDGSPHDVIRHARAFLGVGCDAVKLEWRTRGDEVVQALVAANIPVMGHVGLTPQAVTDPAGFRVQGRTAEQAIAIVESAQRLARAGCFSLVLECIPTPVADVITKRLTIPTIGIGAGPHCDGQVLVLHDVVGLYPLFSPKFAKRYAALGEEVVKAIAAFRQEVIANQFPAAAHTFQMSSAELQRFRELLHETHTAPSNG